MSSRIANWCCAVSANERMRLILALLVGLLTGAMAVETTAEEAGDGATIVIDRDGVVRIDGRRIVLEGDATLEVGDGVLTISPEGGVSIGGGRLTVAPDGAVTVRGRFIASNAAIRGRSDSAAGFKAGGITGESESGPGLAVAPNPNGRIIFRSPVALDQPVLVGAFTQSEIRPGACPKGSVEQLAVRFRCYLGGGAHCSTFFCYAGVAPEQKTPNE